jgi:serine phosphatase RsbU (regulator of sigma subunit)
MTNFSTSSFANKILRLSLRKKVNFIGLLIIVLFSVILFYKVLPLLEAGKLEERKGKLQAVVNSVTSLMLFYEHQVRKEAWKTDPSMPKNIEEAKAIVIKNIREMRYDKTEYFFILDGNGNMVMHPLKPELEKQNMMEVKNPAGYTIFKEMVLNSQRDNETFVQYTWQSKYSPIIFEPQTTYSKYVWQWDWVVCSGVYTQDILDSMKEINYLSAGYVLFTSALTIFVLFVFVYFNLTRPLTDLLKGIEEIKKDNLDYKVRFSYGDELGNITEQFNEMIVNRKQTQEELKRLNASLEEKVIQRTAQLNASLEEVQELKIRQDGDYFLTSLLIQPLQSQADAIKTSLTSNTYIKQYKSFSFRKWNAELGGDLCITDNIKLNGRDYFFFVNADAMGKSIQGAGGALIFGASVKANLIRTKIGKPTSTLPELWLKNLYYDLHQLFRTFDGSMLISAVMGLIDQVTGLVYYINAEHPWVALYRDGVSSFIEDTLTLRKIGTPEKESQNDTLKVKLFQMKEQDTIILGSDGRDDIIIKSTDGSETVNNDETLFLKVVNDSDAQIDQIIENISKNGILKDDLSLITIHFNGSPVYFERELALQEKAIVSEIKELISQKNYKEALSKINRNFDHKQFSNEIFNLTKKIYLEIQDYTAYSRLLVNSYYLFPESTEQLTEISQSLVLSNQLELAADFAECLHLREPGNVTNLMNLASIYYLSAHYKIALRRINEALSYDPLNQKALDIKQGIETALSEIRTDTGGRNTDDLLASFEY